MTSFIEGKCNGVETDKPVAFIKIELKFGNLVFWGKRKPKNPAKSHGSKATTNSNHMRQQVQESNPGHRGWSQLLIHNATLAPLSMFSQHGERLKWIIKHKVDNEY